MKKLISLTLIVVMCLALLTACGGSKQMTVEKDTLIMATNAEFPPMSSLRTTKWWVSTWRLPRPLLRSWV